MADCGCAPKCACGAEKIADCKCCCTACGEKCGCEKCACSKKATVGGDCCAGGEGCCAGGCSCGTGCQCKATCGAATS